MKRFSLNQFPAPHHDRTEATAESGKSLPSSASLASRTDIARRDLRRLISTDTRSMLRGAALARGSQAIRSHHAIPPRAMGPATLHKPASPDNKYLRRCLAGQKWEELLMPLHQSCLGVLFMLGFALGSSAHAADLIVSAQDGKFVRVEGKATYPQPAPADSLAILDAS